MINEATELDDADTADLFTQISRGIDHWLWFIEGIARAEHDQKRQATLE